MQAGSTAQIRRAIQEMTAKYLPLLNQLELVGRRALERTQRLQLEARRKAIERTTAEELRLELRRNKLRSQIEYARKAEKRALAAVNSFQHGHQVYDPVRTAYPGARAVEDTLDWITQLESEPVVEPAKSEGAAKADAAASGGIYKPDPFVVSAPMYKEGSGVRLACKKCDHTISRGARGVHLFSWYDNYHLSLNEELFDTVLYKEVTDPVELKRSSWKRCKVACPCCGSSLGSLGLANGRMKMMLKSVNLAWRKSGDNTVQIQKNKQVSHKWLPTTRPLGTSLMSSWLHSNAGLMTHNRRWVLDTTVLHALLDNATEGKGGSSGNQNNERASSNPTNPASNENDQTGECVVRSSEFENPALNETMRMLLTRSMAFESIVTLPFTPSLKGLVEMSNHFEEALSKKAADVPKDAPYDQSVASGLAFIRLTVLNKVAQLGADPERANAITALLKTPRFATMTKQCAHDISQNHQIADYIPVRTLTSVLRVLYHHKHAFPAAIKLLSARKEAYGPYAGVFGRSSEYLLTALRRAGFDEATIAKYMSKVSCPHPTPGGRFGEELDPSGFTELYCTTGNGYECNRRATHGPHVPPNASRAETIRGRIPVFCRSHAPVGYAALAEGFRGVIPPSDDPHNRFRAAGITGGPGATGTWRNRRNRIVEVPDAGKTEPMAPEPGTLFLGEAYERNVRVAYTPEEFSSLAAELEKHLEKAEQALNDDPQKRPSMQYAISLDVEWKPEFVYDPANNVCSLIQIATRDACYVIDALALGKDADPVLKRLLKSPAIIKVGHGLAEDFARIAQGLSQASGVPEKSKEYFPIESVLELSEVFIKAENRIYTNGARPSLATMVEVATGSRLDKRCQMTDWERRPLSPAQVRYAATDAGCAFLVYDVFAKKLADANNGNFDVSEYLERDEGTTSPQRALPQQVTDLSSGGAIMAAAAAEAASRPTYQDRSAQGQMTRYRQPYHAPHPPGGAFYSPVARVGSHLVRATSRSHLPIMAGHRSVGPRKILSKWELRRLRELRLGLLSQGVRVDEHARLEGLQVASNHLQKSLSKVVRDSLVDRPEDHDHDDHHH